MAPLPEPGFLRLLRNLAADLDGQCMHGLFRQLGPSPAIVSRVGGRNCAAGLLLMGDDAGHGRLARSLLAVAQDLTEERPDDDRSRVDGTAEQVAMLGEHSLDPLGGQQPREGKPRFRKKRLGHPTKTALAPGVEIGYAGHRKTLLGFIASSKPRRANLNSQGRLSPQDHLQRAGKITKPRLRAYRIMRSTQRAQSDSAIRVRNRFRFRFLTTFGCQCRFYSTTQVSLTHMAIETADSEVRLSLVGEPAYPSLELRTRGSCGISPRIR